MCVGCPGLGGNCFVIVSLFIVAPIVYVGYVLSWAVIVLLLFPCLLLLLFCVCRLCIVLGGDCVIVVSLLIAAPFVCVGCVLSWAVIVLLFFNCLLLPHCVCR